MYKFFLTILFLQGVSFASAGNQLSSPYNNLHGENEAKKMEQVEQRIVQECFANKSWIQIEPKVSTKAEVIQIAPHYSETKFNTFVRTPMMNTIEVVGMGLGALQSFFRYPGRVLMERMVYRGLDVEKFESLNSLQRACMAQCISSNIIEYDEEAATVLWEKKDRTLYQRARIFSESVVKILYDSSYAVHSGKGICHEYPKIFNYFARSFGLASVAVAGPYHGYNAIRTSNGVYFLEPADNTCEVWK